MQIVTLETKIAAPIERCFLLSLSIDLHLATVAHTEERAIAGTMSGLIGMGESVTWRGRHFGLMLTHTSKITHYERPYRFQDEMTHGLFAYFIHDHRFQEEAGATHMIDELRFASPLGPLGKLVDRLVLREHMKRFLDERNQNLKRVAESEEWRRYLPQP